MAHMAFEQVVNFNGFQNFKILLWTSIHVSMLPTKVLYMHQYICVLTFLSFGFPKSNFNFKTMSFLSFSICVNAHG